MMFRSHKRRRGQEHRHSSDAVEQKLLQEKVTQAEERLARLRAKAKRLQSQIDLLQAQIVVLGQELLSPAVRQTLDRTCDPEIDRGKPSLSLSARMHRRQRFTGVNTLEGLEEPISIANDKSAAREFARQHGISVADVLGRWPNPDAVDWNVLPERFVLKSSHGGGGVNVYPLQRVGDGFLDHLTNEGTTQEEVTERLWAKHLEESSYFAEAFLTERGGGGLPNDVKVFCFYGEVGWVEARTGDWSRARRVKSEVRTFLPDGKELFNFRTMIEFGRDISVPNDIAQVAEVCAQLSRAIRRPFERLDFYETDHGLFFGEITPNPGHIPALTPEWDSYFGDMYEQAYARLLRDLAAEGAIGVEYGDVGIGWSEHVGE